MDYMTFINENYVAIILGAVIVLMTIIGYFADKKTNSVAKTDKKKNKKEEKISEDTFEEFDTPTDLEPEVNEMDSFNEMPNVEVTPVSNDLFENIPEELFEGVNTYSNPVNPVESNISPVEPVQEEVAPVEPIKEEVEPVDVTNEEIAPVEDIQEEVTPVETVEETPAVENNEVELENVAPVEPIPEEVKPVEPIADSVSDWTSVEETPDVDTGIAYDDMVETPTDTVEDSEWTTVSSNPVEEEEDNSSDNDSITFDGVADDDFKLPTIDKLNDELADVADDEDDVWKF